MSWPWIVLIIAALVWLTGAIVLSLLFRLDARRGGERVIWKDYAALFLGWPAILAVAAFRAVRRG